MCSIVFLLLLSVKSSFCQVFFVPQLTLCISHLFVSGRSLIKSCLRFSFRLYFFVYFTKFGAESELKRNFERYGLFSKLFSWIFFFLFLRLLEIDLVINIPRTFGCWHLKNIAVQNIFENISNTLFFHMIKCSVHFKVYIFEILGDIRVIFGYLVAPLTLKNI